LTHRGLRAPSHRPKKGETVSPLKTTATLAGELGVGARTLQQRKQIAAIPQEVRDVIRALPVASHTRDLLELARAPEQEQSVIAAALAAGTVETVREAKTAIRQADRQA